MQKEKKWCASVVAVSMTLIIALGIGIPAAAAAGAGALLGKRFQETKKTMLNGMNVFYGNLHSHSSYSNDANKQGGVTPEESFRWARDVAGFNFYVVSDHDVYMNSAEWADTGIKAEQFNQTGRFVAMRGFEWSNPLIGHVNVFNTPNYTKCFTTPTVGLLYGWLKKNGGVAQYNHPGRERQMFNGLRYDGNAYENMCCLETGNKDTGNNDGEFFLNYVKALDNGWRVAPTSGQDNHNLNAYSHRTAAIARTLSRESILEALAARRLYSTDDSNLQLLFKNADNWMGSKVVRKKGNQVFNVLVEDDENISKLELISNGGKVVTEKRFDLKTDNRKVVWDPVVNVSGSSYYFVRVTERDTNNDDHGKSGVQVALTAPIWITQ